MFPKSHIILNFFICLPLLFILSPFYVIIIFLSSFLIDVDHYLYYVIEEKNLSLRKAYKWFKMRTAKWLSLTTEERRKHAYGVVIFHGIEPLTILFFLSMFFPTLFFVFLGFLIHMIEDLIEEIPLGTIERKIFLTYSIYVHLTKTKFYKKYKFPKI